MSKLQMFTLYDTVAMTMVGGILLAHREEQAHRTFGEILSNKETQPGQYPADFTLLHIGEINTENGEVTPAEEVGVAYTGNLWLKMKELDAEKARAASAANDAALSARALERGTPPVSTNGERTQRHLNASEADPTPFRR